MTKIYSILVLAALALSLFLLSIAYVRALVAITVVQIGWLQKTITFVVYIIFSSLVVLVLLLIVRMNIFVPPIADDSITKFVIDGLLFVCVIAPAFYYVLVKKRVLLIRHGYFDKRESQQGP